MSDMEAPDEDIVTLGAATGGLGGALAALFATLCCLGPSAVALLGAGGALAAASLAPYRPLFLVGSAAVIALAFWRVYSRRGISADGAACRVRSGGATRLLLWLAAVVWLIAAVMPTS